VGKREGVGEKIMDDWAKIRSKIHLGGEGVVVRGGTKEPKN